MSEVETTVLSSDDLYALLEGQRWFARHAEDPVEVRVVDQAELSARPPRILDLLAEVAYAPGDRAFYQLLVALPETSDALADPAGVRELLNLLRSGASIAARDGTVEFSAWGDVLPDAAVDSIRSVGVEQSNSSVVVDGQLLVKVYRRLEAGISPELELLRFLAAHGFPNSPEPRGWWSYTGVQMAATLGLVQRYIPDAIEGWQLALADLETPEFAGRVARLGEVVGAMHATLASDPQDPAFAPELATRETFSLLAATVDDEIEQMFLHLPDDERLAPIVGRDDAARELLRSIGTVASPGSLIRHHGDLHLGQVLWAGDDWFIVDFEGEPARTLSERRSKRSPLRDVAGMLRSLNYVVQVAAAGDELEQRLRTAFLDAYLASVQSASILPAPDDVERLITIFELEKTIYELRYELAYRPDWVWIPVAGFERLLERASA
jgi:trehalose synthase-fused probable maltokinase